jgi:hypothetical protein
MEVTQDMWDNLSTQVTETRKDVEFIRGNMVSQTQFVLYKYMVRFSLITGGGATIATIGAAIGVSI